MRIPLVATMLAMVTTGWAAEGRAGRDAAAYVPPLGDIAAAKSSGLREIVERYTADRAQLLRFYDLNYAAQRQEKLGEFYRAWQQRLAEVPFEGLGVEERVDYVLLQHELVYELRLLARAQKKFAEMEPIVPFAEEIAALHAQRRSGGALKPADAAAALERIRKSVEATQKAVESGLGSDESGKSERTDGPRVATAAETQAAVAPLRPTKIEALRAAQHVTALTDALEDWFKFSDGYDPLFSWWCREPEAAARKALQAYAKVLREKVVGYKDAEDAPIVGDPIGSDGLQEDLEHEMIAYSPEELLEIANREFAWCDAEWKRTARELGFGDDWKAALERAKQDYVAPGEQVELVRKLAREAIDYVTKNELVTIPPLAGDGWRTRMMTPEEQKTNPFFLGGESIWISFPTDGMPQKNKVQALRANNVHFSKATVFHELMPGHGLQFFMLDRYQPHRQIFMTPFWVEGWSLWWEFQLYQRGYTSADPLDRAGALFWRSHRCARIIFSLNFHLGKWTPQQCVDFLVERVGHERASAEGEVRRSFNGDYSPLYQVGYMMGALQLRALHGELVTRGGMNVRAFHDAILHGGPMPIELVRARLKGEKLPRDGKAAWRFAE